MRVIEKSLNALDLEERRYVPSRSPGLLCHNLLFDILKAQKHRFLLLRCHDGIQSLCCRLDTAWYTALTHMDPCLDQDQVGEKNNVLHSWCACIALEWAVRQFTSSSGSAATHTRYDTEFCFMVSELCRMSKNSPYAERNIRHEKQPSLFTPCFIFPMVGNIAVEPPVDYRYPGIFLGVDSYFL